MICQNCENAYGRHNNYDLNEEPVEYKWRFATVRIIACDEHLKQIIEALDKAQA